MADVTGSISTLPGSVHTVPKDMLCDGYNCECDKPAVIRIQGETDSFGSEMNDYCQECHDKGEAEEIAYKLVPRCCDWCKKSSLTCAPTRDFDEGLGGPVYDVCSPCRQKQMAAIEEESRRDDDEDDDY